MSEQQTTKLKRNTYQIPLDSVGGLLAELKETMQECKGDSFAGVFVVECDGDGPVRGSDTNIKYVERVHGSCVDPLQKGEVYVSLCADKSSQGNMVPTYFMTLRLKQEFIEADIQHKEGLSVSSKKIGKILSKYAR